MSFKQTWKDFKESFKKSYAKQEIKSKKSDNFYQDIKDFAGGFKAVMTEGDKNVPIVLIVGCILKFVLNKELDATYYQNNKVGW